MRRALIETRDGQAVTASAWTAWAGFRQLGVPTDFFAASELPAVGLDRDTLVCGTLEVVRQALGRLDVTPPFVHPTPPELAEFLGREVWTTTLGHVRADTRTLFIKPLYAEKAFPGHVRRGELTDLQLTAHLPDDFPVLASDVVTFVSEWRLFIVDGHCVDARPYRGDYRTPIPDLAVADPCLAAYRGAPAAHTLDLGRTPDGRTLLIEINDAYSVNSYGLPPVPYAQFLERRWDEIVGADERKP